MKSSICRTIAATALLFPVIAFAHPGHDEAATFVGGVMHPLLGPDHILAAVAVGLLAAQHKSLFRWMLPIGFVVAMSAAFTIAREIPAWSAAEMLVAFSLLGLGAAFFWAGRRPVISAMAVIIFGAVHGYVHGTELPGDGDWIAYALGLALATAGAHAVGLVVGTRVDPRLKLGAKIAAAAIASIGATMLGMQLIA
ncbi:MAG: HupE/UreJ family protein [Betaproteobacteria bacterium]